MKRAASALRIERKSSIETEPRTLNLDQIQDAREAALYVVKTKSLEEALDIFTRGLKPVARVGEKEKEGEDMGEDFEFFPARFRIAPLMAEFRDVASAPF